MLSTRTASDGENHVTLGCFEVRGGVYAIDVSQLREVVRWQRATPLPHAPELIEGVIDLRGVVVPVVDLGRGLGLGPIAAGPRARICVTETDGLIMGLAVDAALEVVPVDVARLEDPPALAIQTGYDAARAVVRRPDAEPILVVSLEHLLERVYRSALGGEEAIR
jgi:purine-binding chemotaxis protein CheW